jgi:uncharacterized protein YbjQ (UPF0145 family)
MKCRNCGFKTGFLDLRDGLCPQCLKQEEEVAKYKAEMVAKKAAEQPALNEPAVIVTTSHVVAGRDAIEEIGIVASEVGYGLNIFKDIANNWRDTFGGRSNTIQNALKDGRLEALAQLKRDAFALGADAVISTRIEYNQISTSGGSGGSILFVAAYGTAVKLSPVRVRPSEEVAAIAN